MTGVQTCALPICHFRRRVYHTGDYPVVNVTGLARQNFGQRHAFVFGLVGEHGADDGIADGVEAGDVGGVVAVGFHLTAREHFDAERFEVLRWLSEVLAVPAATAKGQLRIRKPRWTPALDFGRSLGAAVTEDDDEVVLLEPNKQFVSCPFSNLVLSGVRTIDSITFSYDRLRAHGVRVLHETATAIEPDARFWNPNRSGAVAPDSSAGQPIAGRAGSGTADSIAEADHRHAHHRQSEAV